MPSLDTYADYFPTYATGVVLVLLGIIIGGLVERRAAWKRLEKRIDERFALNEEYLVEALEEYRHPLYEYHAGETDGLPEFERLHLNEWRTSEPLAPPEAYEPGTCQHQRRVQVGGRLICDDCGGIGFVHMLGAPEAGTLTAEERAEEYQGGTERPRFTDFSGPYTWTSDEPMGRL